MSNYFSFSMTLFISLVVFAALLPSPALSTSLDNNKVHTQEATIDQLAATVTGRWGEFYVDLLIGTPPTHRSLALDTDSDLIWSANCSNTSTSYSKLPCNNTLCTKAKGSCDQSKNECLYKYKSNNYSTFHVDLATETFTFDDDRVKVAKLAFACAAVERLTGGLGLGRGPPSLVSQMNAHKLSYCLPKYDETDKKGFLYVGSLAKSHPEMITTSLVKNPHINPSSYYIAVQAISIGKTRLPIDISAFEVDEKNGTGGFVIDTRITMTYLNEEIFNPLEDELVKQIGLKRNRIRNFNLPVCYITPSDEPIALPNITLHFNSSSKLTLSLSNTFRQYTDSTTNQSVTCLAMAVAPYSDHGMSSFGNIQLQDTLVFMDLAKQTVGFLPNTECDTVK